jgi:hypothetical protein
MQTFLEGLTATHDARFFLDEAERLGNPLRDGIRGSPLNFGSKLQAEHPVIRTNRKCVQRIYGTRQLTLYSCHGVEVSIRK